MRADHRPRTEPAFKSSAAIERSVVVERGVVAPSILVRIAIACLTLAIGIVSTTSTGAADSRTVNGGRSATQASWQALAGGAIVVFRHTLAPGTGDPANFTLGDCSTQRNLNDEGREQASRIGAALKQRGVEVGAVWASQWCRTMETAQLLGIGPVQETPAFNSFFADRREAQEQTALARRLLLGWRGPGALIVVTHQVNITALTDIVPRSGEGVVIRFGVPDPDVRNDALDIVGRILP